ncbi:hypothetical protein [Gemmobacter denitrificans]|uniref:Uncharacterized protein n=1 Tax=Gemmobacter denitrificans TaxID=3123040 RepID=A0ABU8BR44_9RHOB
MFDWLKRNAEPLSALGGLATSFAALTALIVIPYQVGQADRIQRDQTAREIYREFLNLTVQKPELAEADFCALKDPTRITAYSAYVEYLLYTAEQMIATSPDWRAPMASYLGDHMSYLCSVGVWDAQSPDIRDLVAELGLSCTDQHICN